MVNLAIAPNSQPSQFSPRLRPTRTEYHSAPVRFAGTGAAGADVKGLLPGEASPSYREVYRISGEMPRGHWLYYGLPVYVLLEGEEFVAQQPHLALLAFGESPIDAIYGLREVLVEQYERLVEMGDRLSPQLKRQRAFLRKLFTGRDA